MRIHPSPSAAICILFLFGACQPRPSEQVTALCIHDPVVEAEITDVLHEHSQAHLNADPDIAADMYTDDVKIMYNALEVNSKNAMLDVYRATYATWMYTENVYTNDETLVCGNAAHVVGHNLNTKKSKEDGTRVTEQQQYMLLWRRQADGLWKMARGAAMTISGQQ